MHHLRLFRAFIALCVVLALGASCGKPASAHPGEGDAGAAPSSSAPEDLSRAPLVPNTQARPGDVTRCPLSGKPFRVTETSPRMTYEGKTYVFCCERCLNEFRKDPAAGVAKLATFEDAAQDDEPGADGAADPPATPQAR